MTQPCDPPEGVPVSEAAALLRCSDRTIRNMVRDGRLEAVKLGPHPQSPVRIPMSSIRALLQSSSDLSQPIEDLDEEGR